MTSGESQFAHLSFRFALAVRNRCKTDGVVDRPSRNSRTPKATVGRQSVVGRDGPDSDMGSRLQRARLSIVPSGAVPTRTQLFFPVQRFREGAYAINEKLGRPIQRPIFYGDDPNIEPRIGKFHW